MTIEERLAMKFVCAKCKKKGATTKRIATTGTGLTRLIDIQHNRFTALTCKHCGYTDLFDLRVLEGRGDALTTVLDVLFEFSAPPGSSPGVVLCSPAWSGPSNPRGRWPPPNASSPSMSCAVSPCSASSS